jgi:glycosyltransferase involved in cell wall biosynthesis
MRKKVMKIAFVSYEFPPDRDKGGIATYTKQISELLSDQSLDIHVFASSPFRNTSEKIGNYKIHWIKSNDPEEFRIRVTKKFIDEHQKYPFDIIESPEINSSAFEIKTNLPLLPLVVKIHAPNFIVEKYKKIYFPFTGKMRYFLGSIKRGKLDLGYWRVYKKHLDSDYKFTLLADAISAPSIWMRSWIIKAWKLCEMNITVLPNPFIPDNSLLQIPIYKELKYKTIVFYGRLNVLKGLVVATKAVKSFLKIHSDWHFKVIGDDGPGPNPLKSSMREWMKNELRNFNSQVEYIDGIQYDKLSEHLHKSEIILIPSLFESFSYVCIEAMAAGKAIIASKNGGIYDLIDNRVDGILVSPFSALEISKALEELVNSPDLCYKIRNQSRKKAINLANDNLFYKHLEFYSSVIKNAQNKRTAF